MPAPADVTAPFASVIVRSYRRPDALLELVQKLREQRYPRFEIVVVEQSEDPALVDRLLALDDARLKVVVRPPLGAPGARNEGIRNASGNVLLFIDDDDLPLSDTWIAKHIENYADPACMGVCGRVSGEATDRQNVRFPRLVRWASFRYSIFRDPLTLPFGSLRKVGIPFAVGNNFSVRSELVTRAGGWDEGVPMFEELSFFFRCARTRSVGEYLVYDPQPAIFRRTNLAGGLDRRTAPSWYENELRGRLIYYLGVLPRYFPVRARLLRPLFYLRAAQQVIFWIWDPDNRSHGTPARVRASVKVLFKLPFICRGLEPRVRSVRPIDHLIPGEQLRTR